MVIFGDFEEEMVTSGGVILDLNALSLQTCVEIVC